ncbi:MAG: hypothetical protein M3Y13_10595 [Armatimonadota bacterium]|nr:hypothetical protein [Armatimonadota bacterium]
MAAAKIGVGYVLSVSVAENTFMGGAMATDMYGLPLEFRYTEPVRATKLQRVLYGDVLEKYIHCDVIAANLIGRLEQKPDFFVVSDPTLLDTLEAAGKKAAMLLPTRVPPLKEFGAQQEVFQGEFLLQLSDSGSPTRVRLASRSGKGTEGAQGEIARLLIEIGRTMDPVEPLARVETAVRLLWEEAPETSAP